MKNSKRKGDNYERKLAKTLGTHWRSTFNRTPGSGAYRGSREAEMVGDIVTDPADRYPFVVEAKHREGGWTLESVVLGNHDVKNWFAQVVGDANRVKDKTPLLIFTRNYAEDFVMVPYHKQYYADLITRGEVMTTKVSYKDPVTTDSYTYHVIITTLDMFLSFDKDYYLEQFDGFEWRTTLLETTESEKQPIKDEVASILDSMFG